MAYGSLITTLGADWANYKKDLDRAYRELEEFHAKTQRLATTTLRTIGGAAGVRGSSTQGSRTASSIDPILRVHGDQMNRNALAEIAVAKKIDQERLGSIKLQQTLRSQAINKNANEEIALAHKILKEEQQAAIEKEKDIQRQSKAAIAAKSQDYKDTLLLEKEERKLSASRAQAEKEDEARTKKSESEKQKAATTTLNQQLGELKAANTKRQAFADEERDRIKANAKNRLDIEKELQQTIGQMRQQAVTQDKEALAKEKIADNLAQTEAKLKNIGEIHLPRINNLMTQFRQAVRVTAGYAAAVGTTSLVGGFALLAKEALDVNVEYQKNRQTIAQILGMTTEWVDQQGKAVDQTRQMNLNYAQADRLLPAIRLQAAKLNLTFQESAKLFSQGFGIAQQRGITPEKAVPLLAQIAELAKAVGSDPLREIRALVGNLRPAQSKILLNVGLDPKSLKEAIQSGKLLDYLNNVLQRGLPYLQRYERQWQVLSTTLVSSAQEVIRIATQRVFEKITGQMGDLDKAFSEANIQKWGKQFGDAINHAYDAVERFVHGDTFKGFVGFFKYLVEHAQTLIEVFAAWKGAQLVGAGMGIAKEAGAIGSIYRQGGGVAALGAASQAVKGEEIGGIAASAAAGSAVVGMATLVAAIYDLIKILELVRAAFDTVRANRSAAQTERETARMRMSPLVRAHTAAEAGVIRARENLQQLQGGFVTSPVMIQAAEKAYAAAQARLRAADKADAEEHDRLSGSSAKKEAEILRQRVIKHQEASDARKKLAAQEALYLARLTAKTTEDDIQKIHAKLDADILAAKKVVANETDKAKAAAFVDRAVKLLRDKAHQDVLDKLEDQRLETKRQVADELGDKKSLAQAEAAINIKKVKDEVTGGVEGQAQAAQRIVAIKEGLARKLKEIDQDVTDKARDNVKSYLDEIRKEAEEQKSLKKETHDLEVKTEKELHNLIKERTQAVKDLYRTQAEEALKAQHLQVEQGRQDLREKVRQGLEQTGEIPDLLKRIADPDSLTRRLGEEDARKQYELELAQRQGVTPGSVSYGPVEAAEAERRAKSGGEAAVKAAGPLAIEQAIDKGIATGRFGTGSASVALMEKDAMASRADQRQQLAEQTEDLGKASEAAKKKLDDLGLQEKELMDGFREASKAIKEKFVKDLVDFHDAFTKFAPDFLKTLREAAVSHVALPAPVKAALQAGTVAPSQDQVAKALGGTPIIIHLNGGDDKALDDALRRILTSQGRRSFVP